MDLPQIASSIGVLAVAIVAYMRASAAQAAAADAERTASRKADAVRTDLEAEITTLKRLLAKTASGEPLTKDMIEDGQLWKDIDAAEAQRLLGSDAKPFLLDVRTPDETRAGIIPGATLIPMDQLQERQSELPSDGTPILVYCAAGGRSAAVCDFLSKEGTDGMMNLLGGFGEWPGPSETPGTV